MPTSGRLTSLILENISQAQKMKLLTNVIFQDAAIPFRKNNFLFFIKPEITLPTPGIKLEAILELIFRKINEFGLQIHEVRILSADYLKQYDLIKQHYGVIADIASQGSKKLTSQARERFQALFGVRVEEVKALGGTEFLEHYSFFNPHSLNCLWQNTENQKLASGTYVEKLRIDLETIYLLNGFNPSQLEHFTEKGRSIVAMNLSGDLTWKDARSRFVGATNPLKAEAGSLRREFLEHKQTLGLSEISQSFNGVHLSAGPVEALVELQRFISDYSKTDGVKDFNDFPFGRQLTETFGHIPIPILQNADIQVDGKSISVFDLTEEKDADEVIETLKRR